MYRFSKSSRKNLDEAHQDFTILFEKVLKERDCKVIEGERGKELQNALYDAGKSDLRHPNSKHNKKFGENKVNAVDVVPWPVDWNDKEIFYHFVGYVKGIADELYREGKISAKIRCGADWDGDFSFKDQTLHDLPHYERILD